MTESQKNHRAPLAPGEIRTHTVGDQTFQVMHVAGGSFTQVTARVPGQPSMVLCTDTNAAVAVRAYADAIDGAERIQAHLREAAALSYNLPDGADMALVTGEPIRSTPQVITPDPGVQVEYATDERPTPSLADDVAALRELVEVLPEAHRMLALARLDRIAAQMPQPTRAWMHRCGMVLIDDVSPPLPCDGCRGPGAWRRLYTLGGERA